MKLEIVMPSGVYRGGAEEALLHLARAHRAAELEITRVLFLEPGDLPDRVAAEGIPVAVLPAGRLRNPFRMAATIGRLAGYFRADQPDWVVSWMTKAHLYAGPAARMAGVKTTYIQMGLPDGGRVDQLCRFIPAHGVLACSEFVAMRQREKVDLPVFPFRLAADPLRFEAVRSTPGAEWKRRLGFDPERPLIGIVGRLQEWKGIHVFAEAFARVLEEMPECQGVIVGGPHHLEPDYPAFLEDRIRALGVGEKLRRVGAQANVAEWMQACDVLVHASREEPFGIVILEAMSLGKPVVATRPGGPEEIIEDGTDGLLAPFGDVPALAGALLRFLNDPAFAAAAGRSAAEKAARFTPEGMARSLRDVLESLEREIVRDGKAG